MATRYFTVDFPHSATGLSGTLAMTEFCRASDASTSGLTAPTAFVELGGGAYSFGFDITTATPAIGTDDHILYEVDGGATLTEERDRYVKGTISPNDYNLDAAISSRANGANYTTTRAGYLDLLNTNLDAQVSTRASAAALTTVEGKVDTIDTTADTILTRTDVATSTRASQASVDTVDTNVDTVLTDLATALTRLARLRELAEGKWAIEAPGVLKIYGSDGTTVIQEWDLFEIDGTTQTTTDVFVRVPTDPATW